MVDTAVISFFKNLFEFAKVHFNSATHSSRWKNTPHHCMKICKKILLAVLVFAFINVTITPFAVQAVEPYNTYTLSQNMLLPTQQAYEAISFIAMLEIDSPQDLFVDTNNYLYIACSARRHIVVLDPARNLYRVVGTGELSSPTGVAVDRDGYIFVADTAYVVQFAPNGELVARFGRPESDLFGQTAPFRPLRLALDAHGSIYVVGEAASNGLITLNQYGEFLGYFGANQATMTLFQALQNFFTPRERRQFLNTPVPPTNVAINNRGAIFTVSQGLEGDNVQMFNIAGNSMFSVQVGSPVDIAISNQGGFFVLDSSGSVFEFSADGEFLFMFGQVDHTVQRPGVFRQPVSIVQDHGGNLYVADALTGIIHIFTPTEFTHWMHLAMEYFQQGMYVQSMVYWEEVLRFHSAFSLAHYAIGQALFLQGDYHGARDRFYLAQHRLGYSEAFWEIRSDWLLNNAMAIFVSIVLFGIVLLALNIRKRRKRFDVFMPPSNFSKVKGGGDVANGTIAHSSMGLKLGVLCSQLYYARKILARPSDAYYEIRFYGKASVLSATVMYFALVFVFFVARVATGFIFAWDFGMDIIPLIGGFVGVIALFVVVNFLVATINEGEGSFKNVYIGTAYAATPFILMAIPITLLSQVLALSEAFVYQFLFQIAIGWSLLLQFIMIKEMHDYEIRDVVKNILLTAFTAVVLVIAAFVLYLLLGQVVEFVRSVVMEVSFRG